MTWGKMDDKFHRNRKVRELWRTKGGREALGVWTFWWSWCLDDGELTGVVPNVELSDRDRKSAELLVKVGLWIAVDDGFWFKDFHEYNPTKTQKEGKKQYDRDYQNAKRLWKSEEIVNDSDTTRERIADESCPARVPDPTRPDLTQPNQESERASAPEVLPHVRTFRAYVTQVEAATGRHEAETPERLKAARVAHDELDRTAKNRGVTLDALLAASVTRWLADDWGKHTGWKFTEWAKQASAIAVAEPARKRGPNVAPPTSHADHAAAVEAAIAEGRPHGEGWADVGI